MVQSQAQPGNWVDPYRAYNFQLMVEGVAEGHFTEVSGLGVRVQSIAYREAGSRPGIRAIPGRVEFSLVTCRFGLTSSRELWDWLMQTVAGTVERRQVSVAMLDADGETEVMRWNLRDAWPTEWIGAPLDAISQTLAIETLKLAHEGIERD